MEGNSGFHDYRESSLAASGEFADVNSVAECDVCPICHCNGAYRMQPTVRVEQLWYEVSKGQLEYQQIDQVATNVPTLSDILESHHCKTRPIHRGAE